MKPIIVILKAICFASFVTMLSGQEIDKTTNDFLGMSPAEKRALASTISKEEREPIIRELKRLLADEITSKPLLIRALAYLGDEEAIQQIVHDFVANDGAGPDGLAPMQNPRLIELVAPEFYREQTMYVGGDVLIMPSSYRCVELTVKILGTASAFTSEVRQWAQSLRGVSDNELRDLIRSWWRANEQFFREKNYQAVQPGPPPSRVLPLQTTVTVPVPGGTPILKVVDIPVGTPKPLIGEAPTAEGPSPMSQTPWLGFALAGGLALLLAGGFWLSFRKRQ